MQDVRFSWISKGQDGCMCEFINNVLKGIITSWSPTTTKRFRDLEVALFLSFYDILSALLCRRISLGQFSEWTNSSL